MTSPSACPAPRAGTGAPAQDPATQAAAADAGQGLPPRAPGAPAPGAPVGSHYDRCFGCGPRHRQGLHLAIVAGEELAVTAEFTVGPGHQGAPGLAHGGILATVMDETLGTLSWLLGVPSVTRRLQADFERPVPVGTALHIWAWITAVQGRKIYGTAEGRIGAPDGLRAQRPQAVFVEVEMEHFTSHGRPEDAREGLRQQDVLKNTRAVEPNP